MPGFIFSAEVKDYFTLDKLNQLENNLLKANINAGKSNLLDTDRKYLAIEVGIPIGR